jgi:hypothetical protein
MYYFMGENIKKTVHVPARYIALYESKGRLTEGLRIMNRFSVSLLIGGVFLVCTPSAYASIVPQDGPPATRRSSSPHHEKCDGNALR